MIDQGFACLCASIALTIVCSRAVEVTAANMEQKFTGKVAIVTGGAKGIGFACAQSLGERGAKVVIADWNETAANEAVERLGKLGVTSVAVKVDVSKKDQACNGL